MSKAPKAYTDFITRFPHLGEAWDAIRSEEEKGPLDKKSQRLIKLAIAIGSEKEGPTNSAIRKALKSGATQDEMEQIVALAAATIGLPSAVAAWCRIKDCIDKQS